MERLVVGTVGRPHGVRGDVFVDLITEIEERLAPGAELWCGSNRLVVDRARRSGTRWLVHFVGVDDREHAAQLTRSELTAEPLDETVLDADPDTLWVHRLIGARVVSIDGVEHGQCVSVIANPASDLLELESGALVPVRFVVSATPDVITIDPPDGLFEVFEDGSR